MIMEDDKIKDLFAGFQPIEPDDSRFMDSLLRSIHAVEMVKADNRAMRRRNRLAVILAAVAGFITGAVSMAFMPTLEAMFAAGISFSVPMMSKPVIFMPEIMSTAAVGVLSVVMAVGVYYLVGSLRVIPERRRR